MAKSSPPSKVTYGTFVNDLKSQNISKVDLYSYGSIDFTYYTSAGELRSVDIPYEASKNDLLISSLKDQSISYTSHDRKFPDEETGSFAMSEIAGTLIFLAPLLLIACIFYQARIISKLSLKTKTLPAEPPAMIKD